MEDYQRDRRAKLYKDPESCYWPHPESPEHEFSHGPGPERATVVEEPPDVRRVSDNQDGDSNQHRPGEYERPPAAKSACAAIAHVAHQGLHQEPRQQPAKPYHTGPGMCDPQLLHVRRRDSAHPN
ncbi:hypothetical protein FH972_012941 [Carpinus fangiana]|uniref:Uncharacterized protein n=1 Tax=Carpinus fangiana TaxID=176857 RepID=A0A5N6R8K1_9ROSI|nr:hypothetical protein FH972_012941 [Carpinus fangiana]